VVGKAGPWQSTSAQPCNRPSGRSLQSSVSSSCSGSMSVPHLLAVCITHHDHNPRSQCCAVPGPWRLRGGAVSAVSSGTRRHTRRHFNQLSDHDVAEPTGLTSIVHQLTRGINILDRIFTSSRVVKAVVRSHHKAVVVLVAHTESVPCSAPKTKQFPQEDASVERTFSTTSRHSGD